jgi:magnesium chelatase family protein
MVVELPQVEFEKLTSSEESNEVLEKREQIKLARKAQEERFKNDYGIQTNSEMTLPQIKKYCQVGSAANDALKTCVNSGRLSARGYHRVLKVARTIADLEQSEKITLEHVNEALMYRLKEPES